MLKLPYGISNFKMLREMGYFYQDRSNFIEKMEAWPSLYHLFLRPRKFGKSLYLSMLQYYYDINEKHCFEQLFGDLYIGKNKTKGANNFLILRFDFSRIDTSSHESTYDGFRRNVLSGVSVFMAQYAQYFPKEVAVQIEQEHTPESLIKGLFDALNKQDNAPKIFLLVDEYDQFANELLAFDTERFKRDVSRNGFVRKFYESIKEATGQGIVGRLFVTGVSSITVDSLTSGFNIVSNLSLNATFHDMMGFTHAETAKILEGCDVPLNEVPAMLNELSQWYNGYLFSEKAKHKLFNPDMLLYFLLEYSNDKEYPRNMLDVNIMTDYRKVRSIFNIGGQEATRFALLDRLLKNGHIDFSLTISFNLEADFSDENFLSLLFYMGILTFKEARGSSWRFEIPNYVIKQLYFEYFTSVHLRKTPYNNAYMPINEAIEQMVDEAKPETFLKIVETVLVQNHSNRDEMSYGEKHLQTLMIGLLFPYKAFMIHSEYEAGREYPDIFLERIPHRIMKYEVVIELKYLKKKDADKLEETAAGAKAQLEGYMQMERFARPDIIGIYAVYVAGELGDWGLV